MPRVLILVGGKYKLYAVPIENVQFKDIYNRKVPFWCLRIIRNFSGIIELGLGEWKNDINENDVIIIFDTEATYSLLKWIKKRYKVNRKIICYRNSVNFLRKKLKPEILKKLGYEVWSYNLDDCKKYGLQYNKQMLRKKDFEKCINTGNNYEYDVVFLGMSKGRDQILANLEKIFITEKLSYYFYVPDSTILQKNKCTDGKNLPYEIYLDILSKSRSILDLVNDNNYGLTFRPVEAIFAEKKLITNYKEIKCYDFYKKENVFLLENEELDVHKLLQFFQSPYEKIDERIIESYDIKAWINRFFE